MKCKVCGSETEYRFSRRLNSGPRQELPPIPPVLFEKLETAWDYAECPRCGVLQTDGLDLLSSAELAEFYPYEPSNRNRANRAVRFVDRATRMFPQSGKRLLAFGPGASQEPQLLKQRGWNVSTCDLAGATFTPESLAASSASFNIITMIEVMEHLRFAGQELSRILAKLEPGGVLVASTGLWSRVRTPSWWYIKPELGHICFWTLQALDYIAQQNDCFVVAMGNTPKLCQGMRGVGQAPIFIRKCGAEDL